MALPSFLYRLASKSAAALRKQRSGKRRKLWSPLLVEALEERLLLSFKPAFLLLDPSAESSLEVSGNGVVQAPGGIGVVDSANRSAVQVSGNGYLSASELDIVGAPGMDISGNGKIQAMVHTGIASQPDPLASLPVPQQPATTFTASKFSGDLYPGTYENGIDISGKATVTLHPGLYYVKGGLEISGQAHVTGAGVVIYVSPQKGQDGLEMSGDAVLTLSPPTSGTYKGITLFQARAAQEEIELTGNAQLNLVGTIYAAGGQLEITGNGQLNGAGDSADFIGSQFIGSDMKASGNGQITLDARDFNALTLTVNLSPTPGMEPNGTLVTNVSNSTISGTTGAFATVELGTNGDTHFGEGTTTADASGNYTLPVALTKGPNTLQIRVTFNGLQVTQTIEVTLDTVPPAITVTAPAAGLVTNQNVTMSGQVTDALSGVAAFQAALDNGTFTTVSLGTGGAFNFTTALPLDHSADGMHTEHLRALDYAGNVSSVDVSVTLDTVPPTITVTAPAAGLVTNQNVTIIGTVSDAGDGVASLQAALDNGSFAAVTLGSGGSFSLATTLPLDHTADGSHTEHLRATDN
ncbi:MAG TPA: Ig-like domain-containing protein, partial [Gemmataceae bacterium]|nr:Ig-like domain-containing protein [Gemmataceae bacterium]